MPVVFAYPQLFTIRGDLGKRYDFRYFKDRDGDDYELVTSPDTSVVIPAKPFSLVDRIPYLQKDGVTKFIVDFSFMDLKKQIYKRVMAAARDGVVLPDTGRFNWKDGFWNPEETATPRNADAGDRQADAGSPGKRPAGRPAGRVAGRASGAGRTEGTGRRTPGTGERATGPGRRGAARMEGQGERPTRSAPVRSGGSTPAARRKTTDRPASSGAGAAKTGRGGARNSNKSAPHGKRPGRSRE
jgi:hypothetical protein